MKKKILVAAFIVFGLSGCASSSKDIGKAYVSPKKYKDYSCDELIDEGAYISEKVQALA